MQKHIILDTDIGGDIDDCWALGMLLNMPGLIPELVLSASGDTAYRAAVAAKFLSDAGASHIPVGIGIPRPDQDVPESLHAWLGGWNPEEYHGTIVTDGVGEAIRRIEAVDEMTVIAIGPTTNLAEICRKRPDLVKKCRLVAMAGSIRKNFRDRPGTIAEYNVKIDIPASKTVFSADWKEFTITPLDHCGNMILDGELYQQVRNSTSKIPQTIIDSYRVWQEFYGRPDEWKTESSILYDTVAVHLAETDRYVEFENMNLTVDDTGTLRTSADGRTVRVAMGWSDVNAYRQELVRILTGSPKLAEAPSLFRIFPMRTGIAPRRLPCRSTSMAAAKCC